VRLLRRRWLVVLPVLLLLTLASCGGLFGDDPPASWEHDPFPDSSFRLGVLGDSYISGEGAGTYLDGTDESDLVSRNMCHRAPTAYSFLAAKRLEASMVLIACSGALTGHVTGKDAAGAEFPPQYRRSPDGVFGSRAQLLDLADHTREVDAVLISIGGNDAGFSTIGRDCVSPLNCADTASTWYERLDSQVYPAIARTFAAVKERAGDAEVFAMTYPNSLRPKFCGDLPWVKKEEWEFLRTFIRRLNGKVRSAAAAAGIRVIDPQRALAGHRFCDRGKPGINFVQVRVKPGTVLDLVHLADLFKESLHPNVLGHELMGRAVLPRLRALRAEELPPPPEPARELPRLVPSEVSPPALPFPPGTPCAGSRLIEVQSVLAPPEQREVAFSSVRPGSVVCFRLAGAEWQSKQVGAVGRVRVPIDVTGAGGGVNHILVQGVGGGWREIVVSRPPEESGG
jgi:lysophospholipase L1-like esterase